MFTRAIHLDVAAEYSTEAFLQAFRRFTSIRGTPEVIFSDSGTQLVGANAIIQAAMREMDRKDIRWEFAPGGAPWRQGCAESLMKTLKKSLFFAVGRQKLSILELQFCLRRLT